MKKIIGFTILLMLSLTAVCQTNYEPGYFIKNDGTKFECLIKNIAWKNNPVAFDYKINEGGSVQTNYIENVTEFSVSGYKYVRFTGDIDRSVSDPGLLDEIKEPEFKKETILLKVLVEGAATLYQYEDGNLVRYFYNAADAKPQQLIYKPYKVTFTQIAYNETFKGQLFTLMKNKLSDMDSFKNIHYNKSELVKLFIKYNSKNETIATTNLSESQNKSELHIKFTPGVNFVSFPLANTENPRATTNLGTKAVAILGAEVEVVLPFNNKKWSLFINPDLQSYKANKRTTKASNGEVIEWGADFKYIEIPVGLRYNMYFSNKSKVFINAAYVASVNLGNGKYTYSYRSNYLPASHTEINITRSSNLALGAGYSYGRYSAEARYSFARQTLPANYAGWNAQVKGIALIIGYRIL